MNSARSLIFNAPVVRVSSRVRKASIIQIRHVPSSMHIILCSNHFILEHYATGLYSSLFYLFSQYQILCVFLIWKKFAHTFGGNLKFRKITYYHTMVIVSVKISSNSYIQLTLTAHFWNEYKRETSLHNLTIHSM